FRTYPCSMGRRRQRGRSGAASPGQPRREQPYASCGISLFRERLGTISFRPRRASATPIPGEAGGGGASKKQETRDGLIGRIRADARVHSIIATHTRSLYTPSE